MQCPVRRGTDGHKETGTTVACQQSVGGDGVLSVYGTSQAGAPAE